MNNRKVWALCVLVTTALRVGAQSVITPFGADVRTSAGSISITVGQVADRSYCDTAVTVNVRSATLTEGVQQPYLKVELLSVPDNELSRLSIEIYPNPNVGEFNIISTDEEEKLTYELYNVTGQILGKGEFQAQTDVNMQMFPAGTYVLRVHRSNNNGSMVSNTYRIVKAH